MLQEQEDEYALRSEPVQDIIGQDPGWIVRSGISLFFVLCCFLLMLAWFIKYPDVIRSSIVIITDPPPVMLVAKTAGNIKLMARNEDSIRAGTVVGYIQSPANVDEVLRLEKHLLAIEGRILKYAEVVETGFPNFASLGPLATDYDVFSQSLQELSNFYRLSTEKKQMQQLARQIAQYRRLNVRLSNQKELFKRELGILRNKYAIDSSLMMEKVLSSQDLSQSEIRLLQQSRTVEGAEAELISNDIAVLGLENRISELQLELVKRETSLGLKARNSLRNLVNNVKKWKETYLLESPIQGRVAHLQVWDDNQYVKLGDPVFAVTPFTENMVGKMELPPFGSGKVKIGQRVNIRLENYPSEEFGFLIGKVKSISSLPANGSLILYATLPQGLKTSYNKKLEFKQEMRGQTEIITEDLRLLERVFNQFREVWSKNNL